MRLLTRFEYDNTVRDLLQDMTSPATAGFPPENGSNGFDNNADVHAASPVLVQAYMEAAEGIADRAITDHWDTLVPCDPQVDGYTACGITFATSFLKRAFRRTPAADELGLFLGLIETKTAEESFEAGVRSVIEATLQSPQFLYRAERQPETAAAPGAADALGGYELASRLSYLLWASMPDDELLAAAATGSLAAPEGLEAQARRLLASPKARGSVRHFHEQWLGLGALDSLVKDATAFPTYEESLRTDWREEINRFIEHEIFEGEGTYAALMTSSKTFVNANLAAFYNVDGPANSEFEQVSLPDDERAGLVTQPGLMAMLANPNQGSPIRRGVFVRDRFLCDPLPPPPADIEVSAPDPDPNATTRERFAEHTENEVCAACHILIDPIGFGFENYDGLGRFRMLENSLPIDATGELTGVDPDSVGAFDGAVELANRLATSEMAQDCYALQWFRYSSGRAESWDDLCSVQRSRDAMRSSGGSVEELVVSLVTSDAFRYRFGEEVTP